MSDFRTKTENEYLRRAHALTMKIVACALAALVFISFAFVGAVVYLGIQQTEQIKIIMSAPVEITREVEQKAQAGDSGFINQTVGK